MADNTSLWSDDEWRAAMSAADINDLPDTDFAYIEPGGEKDDEGKTIPRSLRHYPIHDEAHVRNALARAAAEIAHGDQDAADIATKSMPAIKAAAKKLGIDTGDEAKAAPVVTVTREPVPAAFRGELLKVREERVPVRREFELREVPNGTGGTNLKFTGFACVTDAEYEMEDWLGTFTETVSKGAFKKTLDEGADTAFLLNHRGMTLARTKSGTMKLAEVTEPGLSPVLGVTGLHSEALFDPTNPQVQAMRSAVDRGDLDEMSFAFRVMRQEWNEAWDQRWINEVSIDKGDVSLVNYGANPHTGGTVDLRQRLTARVQRPDMATAIAAIAAASEELRAGKTISAATAETLAGIHPHLDAMGDASDSIRGIITNLIAMSTGADNGGCGCCDDCTDDCDGSCCDDCNMGDQSSLSAPAGLFREFDNRSERARVEAMRHYRKAA